MSAYITRAEAASSYAGDRCGDAAAFLLYTPI
jgi:hypothetical protein